jgi:hypothetical protein
VSHELKTKGDKVSALRKLREGHGQKEKKIKGGQKWRENEWREERKGEKRRMCKTNGEKP